MVPNGRIPRPHSMQQARREEQGSAVSSQSINNVPVVNPVGIPAIEAGIDESKDLCCTMAYLMVSWNVCGMSQGKSSNRR